MNREFTSQSGAEIVIAPAPFSAATELKKAMQLAALNSGANGTDSIMRLVWSIDSTDSFNAALWPCLVRCTRNGEKITPATFDPPETRVDYYEIVGECIKVNLGPLQAGLAFALSKMEATKKKPGESQSSK